MADLVNNRKCYNVAGLNSEFRPSKTLFSALLINCRSIKRKVGDIDVFLRSISIGFYVLDFSKPWITYKEDAPFFLGYRNEIISREQQEGGGISIYCKHAVSIEALDKYAVMNDDIE